MSERQEHKIGQVVFAKQLDPESQVPRFKGKQFVVKHGSTCTGCAMQGLGHIVCGNIACAQSDRTDNNPIVYVEKED